MGQLLSYCIELMFPVSLTGSRADEPFVITYNRIYNYVVSHRRNYRP
jgi:hypothetical protein